MAANGTKVMHGARAVLAVGDADNTKKVGIFNNVSYGVAYDANPIYLLGRFNPAEIALTGQEPVSVTASGWRMIDEGPHVQAKVPHLKDLLSNPTIMLTIVDRQSGETIMHVDQCVVTGYTTSLASRTPQEITVNFMGLAITDESDPNDGDAGAVNLP